MQVDRYLSAQQEGDALPKSFRILLRSPNDIVIPQQPSWWTPSRILVVLAVSVLTTLLGSLWVFALKRRVAERTETIRATLESTTEGILVVDSIGRVVEQNRKFETMWGGAPSSLKPLDYGRLLEFFAARLRDPEAYARILQSAYAEAKGKTDDVVELTDGRVLECRSEPQTVKGKYVGRVWGFRDVTDAREWTRQLQVLANSDSLTGLNRRAIFEFLTNELERESQRSSPVTVIMADLDGFKKINDIYGHPAGDAVLRETAQRLRSGMRTSDCIGRYGGEEFLIVLPGCEKEIAARRAEEFRFMVEGGPVVSDTIPIPATCSFGVASTTGGTDGIRELLQDADAALYRAKRAGRNRVVMSHAGALCELSLSSDN